MKKKIIAICLCVALVAVGIVGATLAYFTDKDQVNNTFAIGNIDIDLYEKTDVYGDQEFQNNLDYSNIMPGDYLSKKPFIRNESKVNAAYVRVAVVMNNLNAIDKAIDGVYEKIDGADVQAVYNDVFDGWGVSYAKRETNSRRLWMVERKDDSEVLFGGQVDMIGKPEAGYAMVDMNNHFQTAEEAAKWADPSKRDGILNPSQGDPRGYYWDAAKADERVYVFYLKLAPGAEYQLFEGLNVPADFTAEQMAMFEGLKIDIYADAIQVDNFDTAKDAFTALEAANPLGWWND